MKRIPLRRLVPHGNLVKCGVFIRYRDTVKVEHFPQNLDNDLLIAVNGEFSDIHVLYYSLLEILFPTASA